MIKQAYFRGLMKVSAAAEPPQRYLQDLSQLHRQWAQQGRDRLQQRTHDYLQRSAQKPAQQPQPVQPPVQQLRQKQQRQKDKTLIGNDRISGTALPDHGFYKGTPIAQKSENNIGEYRPSDYRYVQAEDSSFKFAPLGSDPVRSKLRAYYESIGRQNRDFYLKQGFRPPKDHKYKTPFPFPNHPKKKQMMLENQHQVRNTRGAQDYSGHA